MAAQQVVWTNDNILEFIELYKRERTIWDPKNPQHKNRNDIALAWGRIQNSMSINCSITDLKKKKESLMTSFRLHLNRKKKCPSYQTCWFAYSALENEPYTYETALVNADPILIQNPEENIAVYKPQSSNSQKTLTLTLKSNNNDETDTQKNNKRALKEEKDEYDMYSQLLAKKLKKLDEHHRDLAMHEIDMIMFRYKMQSGNKMESIREHNYSASPLPIKKKEPIVIVTAQNDTQYEDENMTYQDINVPPQLPS
ncbi:Uncharacterized protein OBRU01_03311 [Operophtera brumata]|uniref:MADF domain-containing protein n=1 Tax=Operophtera brumata TaxID=104452 RepID=A0A0L7LR30_OPEBR|nr:Uncharacterized protein OBRU01_03311 [Operophtera brumata]